MMNNSSTRPLAAVSVLLAALLVPTTATASDTKPINKEWHLGIGVGGQILHDYRGSNQAHAKMIPIPLLLHNGKFLKVNRDGARGEFFNNQRLQIDLSADAALSGNSDKNNAREGMPKLDSAVELGPSMSIFLAGKNFDDGWSLRLPVRAVFTLNSRQIEHQGYVFNPRLNFRKPKAVGDWGIGFAVGALWGSRDYHDYYYTVSADYATDLRPAYQASGGYAGSYSKLSTRRQIGDWLIGAYIRYDNLSGATFEHSPLVKTQHYGAFGFGIGKTFWSF